MSTESSPFAAFSDRDLLAEAHRLAASEREATARLIACLMEVDTRRLYLAQGWSSLFTYCTQALALSESAAYARIQAARAARRFAVILDRLADGTLTLTTICLLAPHLTAENHLGLLDAAAHRSKREVESLVARIDPRPDAPAVIRKLPEKPGVPQVTTCATLESPTVATLEPRVDRPEEPLTEPAGPGLFASPQPDGSTAVGSGAAAPALPSPRPRGDHPACARALQTAGHHFRRDHEKLRRAQDLLRHVIPDGNPAAVLDCALTELVDQRDIRRDHCRQFPIADRAELVSCHS